MGFVPGVRPEVHHLKGSLNDSNQVRKALFEKAQAQWPTGIPLGVALGSAGR
jgi:hypothetical protein